MSRTKAVALTALISLLTIAVMVIAYLLGTQAFNRSQGALDDPKLFSNTRYQGTLPTTEGLNEEAPDDAIVVVRFFDEGRTATITSPTLDRYSELTWEKDFTYVEKVVTGEGGTGTKWTFTPNDQGSLDISYKIRGGEETQPAPVDKTGWEDVDHEPGLAQMGPASEIDDIDFGENAFRFIGSIEVEDDDGYAEELNVIVRTAVDYSVATITYPDEGCYAVLETDDYMSFVEPEFSVGDCEPGAIWEFFGSDGGYVGVRYTSEDYSLSGFGHLRASDWEDTEGEVGIARSGPAVFENSSTKSNKGKGDCSNEALREAIPNEDLEGYPKDINVVEFCDGEWARARMIADVIYIFKYEDGDWQRQRYGMDFGFTCFYTDELKDEGAPPGLFEYVVDCDDPNFKRP